MSRMQHNPAATPCLCNALRQATRAVSRLYDEELRDVGLRTTQYSLLRRLRAAGEVRQRDLGELTSLDETTLTRDRKSTRLNSSHLGISYAVFCLKKKK